MTFTPTLDEDSTDGRRGGAPESRSVTPSRRRLGLLAVAVLAGCATGPQRDPAAERARGAATTLTLPLPRSGGTTTVEEALAHRRSVRAFTPATLDVGRISQLMWAAQGITHGGNRRSAPSAGALYPLELYVVTNSRPMARSCTTSRPGIARSFGRPAAPSLRWPVQRRTEKSSGKHPPPSWWSA
jgi:hypothetical protein